MKPTSYNLFCPSCNRSVTTDVIARGRAEGSVAGYELADDPLEYYGDSYVTSICNLCKSPFLLLEASYMVDPDAANLTAHKVLYPVEGNPLLTNLPPTVQRPYLQAVRNYDAAQYESSVLMCRRTLEAVCKDKGITTGNLNKKLDGLHTLNIIDSKMIQWAHSIRMLGNEAAHDTDIEIQKDDSKDIVEFTEALLFYIYELNKKFDEFKTRRKGAGG